MNETDFSTWLDRYGNAWREGDAEVLGELFHEDAVYRETPYDEPMHGLPAIRAYWTAGAAEGQKEVRFTAEVLSTGDSEGIAHWSARFTRKHSGAEVELDGILRARFDREGRCTAFDEWWHRRETPGGRILDRVP